MTRTLAANGYVVTRGYAHPDYLEIGCEKSDVFGCELRYLVAVTDRKELDGSQVEALARRCSTEGRILVVVGREGAPGQLPLGEFFDRLGGEVPRWRALTGDYHRAIRTAARNRIPRGHRGPAWRLLEDLAADGLEFSFGRRARRLGGRTPGARTPDVLVVAPDLRLYLLDAKAASSPFDASWPNLRALGEYVDQQRERQRGSFAVNGAVIVSSGFAQREAALARTSLEFAQEHRVALAFLPAEVLSTVVAAMREHIDVRNAVQWRRVLQGGLVTTTAFEQELRRTCQQRVSRQ
jgi:hypothetical protein